MTVDVTVYNDDIVDVDENVAADDDDDDGEYVDADATSAAEAGMTSRAARTGRSDVIKQTTEMTTRRLEMSELKRHDSNVSNFAILQTNIQSSCLVFAEQTTRKGTDLRHFISVF